MLSEERITVGIVLRGHASTEGVFSIFRDVCLFEELFGIDDDGVSCGVEVWNRYLGSIGS